MEKISLPNNVIERLNQSYFYDRLFFCLKEDGVNISYGDFYSKCKKNGVIKVLKSLGLYLTKGKGYSKASFINSKLLFIIKSTIFDSETVAKTIIEFIHGSMIIEKFSCIDLSRFYLLPDNDIIIQDSNYGTYIVQSYISGLFKIGKTKDLGKRISQLTLEYGRIILIGFSEKDIESILHIEQSNYRLNGEWFGFDLDTAISICNKHAFKYKVK